MRSHRARQWFLAPGPDPSLFNIVSWFRHGGRTVLSFSYSFFLISELLQPGDCRVFFAHKKIPQINDAAGFLCMVPLSVPINYCSVRARLLTLLIGLVI
jgi:hypothetical protein